MLFEMSPDRHCARLLPGNRKKKGLTMMLDWDEHREGELEVLRTRMSWERSGGERFVQFNLGAPPNNTARLVFATGLQHPVS